MNTHRAFRLALLLLLLTLVAGFVAQACHEADTELSVNPNHSSTDNNSEEAAAAIVGLAQSYHSQADIAVTQGDLPAAEKAMRELLQRLSALRIEHRERYEQRLDAHGRLARILLDQGKITDAELSLKDAIALIQPGAPPSLFAGYLFQIQGDIYIELGRPADVIASHRKAIEVFQAILDANPKSDVP